MQKLILFVSISFLFGSNAFASNSKPYEFIFGLIETLEYCQMLLDEDQTKDENFVDMMSKSMRRIGYLENGKKTIQPYLNDNDRYISSPSKGINAAMDVLIEGQNKVIQKLRVLSNVTKSEQLKEVQKDFQYEVAQILTKNIEAWKIIANAVMITWPVFINYAKENDTKVSFKISDKERKTLIQEIDNRFGKTLAKYRKYRKLVEAGKKGNPDDQTTLIVSVSALRTLLIADTYEQREKMDV